MVQVAQSVSPNQESLLVAHLRNTAASAHFELNELRLCRKEYEISRSIREERLPPNDKEVAVILANLGNLETSEENFDEARLLFKRAAAIRQEIGDSAAIMLALTYLQIGRVDSLVKDYPSALKMLQKSEALFNRQTGARDYLAEYVNSNCSALYQHCGNSLLDAVSSLPMAISNTLEKTTRKQ
jgi:tetratricopeptide (TPR) repeat protein